MVEYLQGLNKAVTPMLKVSKAFGGNLQIVPKVIVYKSLHLLAISKLSRKVLKFFQYNIWPNNISL